MVMEFLYFIDPETMILGLLFIIFLAIINFSLNKVTKNKGISAIIAFCVSLMAIYGIQRLHWDLAGFFYNIGLGQDALYTVVPIIILVALIIFWNKFGLGKVLLTIGLFLVAIGFTPLIYNKGLAIGIGAALCAIGGILNYRRNEGIKRKRSTLKIEDITKKKDKVRGNSGNSPSRTSNENGKKKLIQAAKKFKRWAKSQPNPKFVGGWTYFINYLTRERWGRNESEICQRLGITQRDFVRIFNRYGKV